MKKVISQNVCLGSSNKIARMKYQEITSFRNLELYCLKKKEREKNHCWVLTLLKRENVCGEWGAFLLYF